MSNPAAEDEKQILEELGLTVVQSRVYLANFDSGPATAKQISKVAGIAREDVYRVMPALQKLGLIKRHITKPAIFEAIPPKEAVTFLLNRRNQETEKIRKEVNKFLTAYKRENRNGRSIEKSEETVLLSSPEANFRRLAYEHKVTTQKIDVIMNWETHKQEIGNMIEFINRGIKRGVKFRSIIDKPNEEVLRLPESAQRLFGHPFYKIRYLLHPPKCRMVIFDGERGFLVSSFVTYAARSPSSLWTNNPILVTLMKEYFEKLWDSAKEIPYQELCIGKEEMV